MEAASNYRPSKRVMLWTHPRTRSTAFELSMASVPSFKVHHEIYTLAACFGPERHFPSQAPVLPGYTFKEVRKMLEANYPSYDVVFAKDGPITFQNDMSYLPNGFIHSFLIRDPEKTIPSLFKLISRLQDSDHIKATLTWGSMQPLLDLSKYVQEELRQVPIVIDSDDLVKAPSEILQAYCHTTGIPFQETMSNWKPGNIGHWHELLRNPDMIQSYEAAIASSSFVAPSGNRHDAVANNDLPQELLKFIETLRPIYHQLRKLKIT
ncbi:uncharacterized protein LOC102802956 [Saccoglossus kowalevskii]|uniref:Uncharacterized protein LOC102802956 n=1 Tax=Saccoglossus kowalevskii TaxID=10224 RepID=A0ABM0MW50_SACKO|nr:PREDICTED: uncharacterized protein LOC102802956 [Saccoglossus kowalevskii]